MTTDQDTTECIVEYRVHGGRPKFDHFVRSMTLNEITRIESQIRHPSHSSITALVRWDG